MIIAIFLMAEAWVLNISYSFNGEQSVINYVSFASTITSLILAVLAIVYGFYQSETGKKSNAALEAHIDAMKQTQGELETFVSSVQGQLGSVTESAKKLERVGVDLNKSVNKIDDLKNEVANIREGQRQGNENIKDVIDSLKKSSKSEFPRGEVVDISSSNFDILMENIFSATSHEVDLLSVLLVEAYDKKYEGDVVDLAFGYYAKPILRLYNSLSSDRSGKYKFLLSQSVGSLGRSATDILTIVGYLGIFSEYDNGVIEFNEKLLGKLRKYSDAAKEIEPTKELAQVIVKSFEKNDF